MRNYHVAASAAVMANLAMAYVPQFVLYSVGSQSVYERQDAILAPGPPGTASGHAHQLFGASGLGPDMSYESLQSSDCTTVGGSTQVDGDKSVYWHPALYASPKDGSDGYIHIPVMEHKLYYSDQRTDRSKPITLFPPGFRMVAGDMTMRGPRSEQALAGSEEGKLEGISSWKCGDTPYYGGGFPETIGNCGSYPQLMNKIHFPHCWNGTIPDKSDTSNSHMAYPESGNAISGVCPSSHSIVLPHIIMEIMFDQQSVLDKIDTNKIFLSQGDATGYGAHADFFNGWDLDVLGELIQCYDGETYGNQNVGQCSRFKPSQKKREACKLQGSNPEPILEEAVAPMLPGCNPIVSQNPAPKRKAAPLGESSTDCAAADGSSSGGSNNNNTGYSSVASPPPSSAADGAGAAAPSATTLSTYVQPSAPAVSSVDPNPPIMTYEAAVKEVSDDPAPSASRGNGVNNHGQRHRNRYRVKTEVRTAVVTVTAAT